MRDVAEPDHHDLMLGPATRLLWRSPDCVHLELGSRSLVVEGLSVPTIRHVAAPTGSRAGAPPADPAERQALAALATAGYLWPRRPVDAPTTGPATAHPEAPDVPRLGGELAALATRHGLGAADVLAARRNASVAIFGASRVATQLGAVLAAAGVGRVACHQDGTAGLRHTAPGGVCPGDEGSPLVLAADRALRHAAPEVDTAALAPGERPDLTILAGEGPVGDDRRRALHAVDAPHLAVSLGIDSGIVGPLVLPGLTSCLRCADLHRLDRDPAWTALALQLGVPGRYGPASEVAVATVAAGVAAMQALAFLDGGEPAVIDATVELRMPDWRLRRRSWPPHPDCDCSRPVGGGGIGDGNGDGFGNSDRPPRPSITPPYAQDSAPLPTGSAQ